MHNIATLSEGKYIFTSLALVLFLVILIFQLESHNRRHLHDLDERYKAALVRISAVEEGLLELRSERERREVVLRVEIGRSREENMELRNELRECREEMRREREVDRNVDMEEKLCLIRGLREIAGLEDEEDEEASDEGLKGLGIDLGESSSYESGEVSESSEDEAEVQMWKRVSEEAWERFDEACQDLSNELGIGRNGEGSRRIASPKIQDERHDEILIDLDEDESEYLGSPETQGERLFPSQREFPLLNHRRNHQRSFTDPGVEAQLNNIFELE